MHDYSYVIENESSNESSGAQTPVLVPLPKKDTLYFEGENLFSVEGADTNIWRPNESSGGYTLMKR